MAFTVRKAAADDINELLRLWQERIDVYLNGDGRLTVKREDWREAVLRWMQHEDAVVLVADRDDGLIGYIVGWVWQNPPLMQPRRYGLVGEMSVDGHCKQGGVGTAMLARLKEWFKARGLDYIEVRVPAAQPIEQAFWRAAGAVDYIDHLYYKLD